MAAIRNPYPHGIFCKPLARVVNAHEVVTDLTDEEADEICRTSIFERGYTTVVPAVAVVAESEEATGLETETEANEPETETEQTPGDAGTEEDESGEGDADDDGEETPEIEAVDLSKLTVDGLRAYAAEHSIDLGDLTLKADIRARIEAAE